MTLESMFYLSQSIAAVAIVGSLLFVGLQVRHSNRDSRHRAIEEMLADYREVRTELASNADLTRVWIEGLREVPTLTLVDRVRFTILAGNFFHTQESYFLHHRDGRMPSDLYQFQLMYLEDFLGYPGLQAAWNDRKRFFTDAFRAMVEQRIAARAGDAVPSLYREPSAESRG
jgi:hypothetical protein